MSDLSKMTDWEKLKGLLEKSAEESKQRKIDPQALSAHLRSRVKGQDPILEDLARLLHLQMAKTSPAAPLPACCFLVLRARARRNWPRPSPSSSSTMRRPCSALIVRSSPGPRGRPG